MTRRASWLLPAGLLLFAAVVASQGATTVLAALAVAQWGLLLVAPYHLVPLLIDAAAIHVLLDRSEPRSSWSGALLARWAGETANSVMPAGQIGGPVVMARHLIQRGVAADDAVAAITVSTTFQTLAQLLFALIGLLLLASHGGRLADRGFGFGLLTGAAALGLLVCLFYLLQRRGLFAALARLGTRLPGRRTGDAGPKLVERAAAIDQAIKSAHSRGGRIAATLFLSLIGWLVGTGEVYWMLALVSHPVSWSDALLIESLGQAIRGAGFAIPGSLGVQEGGYLLIGSLVGLTPDVALALSLGKRAREILWALPGLLCLHRFEQAWRRRRLAAALSE